MKVTLRDKMIVKERERVGFNFKGLFKAFVEANPLNSNGIENELAQIIEQEDGKRISELEKYTDASRIVKANRAGKRRKRSGLDVQTVQTKTVSSKRISPKTVDIEERGE